MAGVIASAEPEAMRQMQAAAKKKLDQIAQVM
jgi:hypothetical protein